MAIILTMRDIKYWNVFLNKKNHTLFMINLYGSFSKYFETNWWPGQTVNSIRNAYSIELEKFRQIDSVETPCDQNERNIDMEGCLQKYMEGHLGCSIPWGPRDFGKMDTCKSEEKFHQYRVVIQYCLFFELLIGPLFWRIICQTPNDMKVYLIY